MANLGPLIRYQKHRLDERQRFLAKLYTDADKVYQMKNRMLDEIARERSYVDASSDPHVITGFLGYQGLMKKKLALIDKEIERIEVRISAARDDLREEFAELKKYEITQQRRLEKQRDAIRKKESQMFDDIALSGFIRQFQEH